MGYACPVCGSPQADGEHLANHLAFTALLHGDGDAHGAWLADHVPDWADRDPDGLASAVVEHAEETDHATVFEDTSGGGRGFDPGSERPEDEPAPALDAEARRIVEEAMEMTRERRAGSDVDDPRDAREE